MRGATVPRSMREGEACGTDCLDSGKVRLRARRGSLAGLQLHDDAEVEAPPQLAPPSPNSKLRLAPWSVRGQVARGFVRPRAPGGARPRHT